MINDHSQNGEATIVAKYFGGYKGTLLDIGANDGITFSNGYDLIMMGWEAHLLEPGKTCGDLFLLHKDNPRVHVYNYGISTEDAEFVFYESGAHVKGGTDSGLVSTIYPVEKLKWAGVEFEDTKALFSTFSMFQSVAESNYDFISIDCEGSDWDILQQINLTEVGCKCLCIEWNSDPVLKAKYTNYVKPFRLRLIHQNAENLIFAI